MKWAKFGKAAFKRNIAFYAVFLGIFTWQVNTPSNEATCTSGAPRAVPWWSG